MCKRTRPSKGLGCAVLGGVTAERRVLELLQAKGGLTVRFVMNMSRWPFYVCRNAIALKLSACDTGSQGVLAMWTATATVV